jgi:hypothetical protein
MKFEPRHPTPISQHRPRWGRSSFSSSPPPSSAIGYGREGREAIGALAAQMLQPPARQAVIRLLGNDDLAAISTWADELNLAEKHQDFLASRAGAIPITRKTR